MSGRGRLGLARSEKRAMRGGRFLSLSLPGSVAVLLTGCAAASFPTAVADGDFYVHEGARIRFQDLGAGRPLVFIHGFAISLDTWRLVVPLLEAQYRLVLLDLKGHGLSDRVEDGQYSVEAHARVVAGLVRHLGLERAVLVGHSYGALVALVAASKLREEKPDAVSALVLIGASLDSERMPLVLRLLRTPVLGYLSLKATSASFRSRMALRRAYYDRSKITDDLVELYAKYQRIPGTDDVLLKTAAQLVPPDWPRLREELGKFELPVLHIWGKRDRVIPRRSAESVCELLPKCELATIPDTGHVPQEESAEKVVELIRWFVEAAAKK
jgi:pimeloyl-ACP methyl ester carboxylesterase